MKNDLEAAVGMYLDGELDLVDAARIEEALAEPGAEDLLGQELLVREVVRTLPAPSAEVLARVGDAVLGAVTAKEGEAGNTAVTPTSALAHGLSWSVKGPVFGLTASSSGGSSAGRSALVGLSTLRYVLGPYSVPGPTKPAKPRSFWRTAAALVVGR